MFRWDNFVSKEPFGLLDASLQIADGVHFSQVDPDRDERLSNFGRQTRDNHSGSEQSRGFDSLHQVVCNIRVHRLNTGDVDNDNLGAICPDTPEQLLRELPGALRINDTDDREDEQTLANLQNGSRQFADRLLLLTNRPFTLLHEHYGYRIGNAVRSWLVGIQDPVQEGEVVLVFREKGACQHGAQKQNDPDR